MAPFSRIRHGFGEDLNNHKKNGFVRITYRAIPPILITKWRLHSCTSISVRQEVPATITKDTWTCAVNRTEYSKSGFSRTQQTKPCHSLRVHAGLLTRAIFNSRRWYTPDELGDVTFKLALDWLWRPLAFRQGSKQGEIEYTGTRIFFSRSFIMTRRDRFRE